jgi:hypothetical protein
MARIKSFGVLQTAKFAAVLYFIISAIFMIPFGLFAMPTRFAGHDARSASEIVLRILFILFMPIIYALISFVFVAIGCLIYNALAKYVGGIEIEIE